MNTTITYVKNGDYYIPNLTIPESKPIGKYGMLCRSYLKQHRRIFYNTLLMTGRLNDYLADIDTQAYELKETLLTQYKEQNGVTEQLKADNQMEWVRLMNAIAHQIDEVILSEIGLRRLSVKCQEVIFKINKYILFKKAKKSIP